MIKIKHFALLAILLSSLSQVYCTLITIQVQRPGTPISYSTFNIDIDTNLKQGALRSEIRNYLQNRFSDFKFEGVGNYTEDATIAQLLNRSTQNSGYANILTVIEVPAR